MTQAIPLAFMAIGACSRDEPQPKFLSATMMSPGRTFEAKEASSSSMQCFASSFGSEVFKYLAGIILSVSMSGPNFQTLPLNFIIHLAKSNLISSNAKDRPLMGRTLGSNVMGKVRLPVTKAYEAPGPRRVTSLLHR